MDKNFEFYMVHGDITDDVTEYAIENGLSGRISYERWAYIVEDKESECATDEDIAFLVKNGLDDNCNYLEADHLWVEEEEEEEE